MAFGIIIKDRNRGTISKENKTEWRNERRVKELAHRGYDVGQIQAMTYAKHNGISSHHVEKMIKHSVNSNELKLDGTL